MSLLHPKLKLDELWTPIRMSQERADLLREEEGKPHFQKTTRHPFD